MHVGNCRGFTVRTVVDMSKKIAKAIRKVHSVRRSAFKVMSEIKNGWVNYVQVPVSMIAYLSIIELLLISVFPGLKNLSFTALGVLSFIFVMGISYYTSKRVKHLRKFDIMSH